MFNTTLHNLRGYALSTNIIIYYAVMHSVLILLYTLRGYALSTNIIIYFTRLCTQY